MMGRTAQSGYFRIVDERTSLSALSQPDFAWEILRRKAGYHAGCEAARQVLAASGGHAVTLIEGAPPDSRSWGLLFRRGSPSSGAGCRHLLGSRP